MDKQTVELLARYNEKTNAAMNALIARLSDEQWNTKYDGFFKSVKSQCNHLYIGDYNWLKRFSLLRPFEYAKDPLLSRQIGFGERVVDAVEDYLAMRAALDRKIGEFASEVLPEEFGKILEYRDSGGNAHARNFGGLILHFFNHQTHHRGMISLYLEFLGVENDYANLCDLL